MPKYIDQAEVTSLFSAACAECRDSCEEFDGFYADCNQCLLHGVKEKLATIPAADVRPVVTCEKCKWHVDFGYHFCYKRGQRCPNDSDFFCAYGELLHGGVAIDKEVQK